MMEPFGAGNERPLFLCRDVEVLGSRTDRSGKHLFLTVRGAGGIATDAVLWDGGDYPIEPQTRVDLVFDLEEDTYYGYGTTPLGHQGLRGAGLTSNSPRNSGKFPRNAPQI
jgi:hypothetical protein